MKRVEKLIVAVVPFLYSTAALAVRPVHAPVAPSPETDVSIVAGIALAVSYIWMRRRA